MPKGNPYIENGKYRYYNASLYGYRSNSGSQYNQKDRQKERPLQVDLKRPPRPSFIFHSLPPFVSENQNTPILVSITYPVSFVHKNEILPAMPVLCQQFPRSPRHNLCKKEIKESKRMNIVTLFVDKRLCL